VPKQPFELRVPFATLLKIALAILLVAIVVKLWPLIVGIVIAVLLAVMFDPLVGWLARHRVRRGVGILLVALVLFGSLAFLLFVVVPSTMTEVRDVIKQLPRLTDRIAASYPQVATLLQSTNKQQPPPPQQLRTFLMHGVVAGKFALEGLTAVIFVFVVAIYLLVEGREAYAWLVALVEPRNRDRVDRTAREMSGVVLAYMRGQAITCFLCGGWAYTVLLLCRVPGALPLAVIAFFADLVPVVGTIAMILPAVLLALLQGPLRALIVLGGYLLYHFIESYFIIPRVYGDQLRLSTLTVLLAVAVGGTLEGALGAVLILPFVAAYPIVERIWLRDRLPRDTVAKHEALAESE